LEFNGRQRESQLCRYFLLLKPKMHIIEDRKDEGEARQPKMPRLLLSLTREASVTDDDDGDTGKIRSTTLLCRHFLKICPFFFSSTSERDKGVLHTIYPNVCSTLKCTYKCTCWLACFQNSMARYDRATRTALLLISFLPNVAKAILEHSSVNRRNNERKTKKKRRRERERIL